MQSEISHLDAESFLNREELESKIIESDRNLTGKSEELKRSEERYHKMIEEVQDYAILLMDVDGIILNWNLGAEKIKGYKEAEIIGKHFRTFYLLQDRENKLPEKLLHEAFVNGRALHEGWRLRKDGTTFWGSIVITALHNDNKEIIGFSKVTRDLSERKLAEDRIQQYASELEFQNRELEEFAYAASHDLKEPLRKIHFYNSYIAEHWGSKLDEKSQQYLERSIAAARRMKQLIEDILSYTKNTARDAIIETVDLGKLVQEIATQHKDDTPGEKVIFNLGELPVINGIPYQLRQVFENLINNSIKYRASDRECVITINSSLVFAEEIKTRGISIAKQYHKISVQDNGSGFDEKYADKIFDIFQRLHAKIDSSGSGIGLSICKKVMQNHGGFIKALGKKDQGAVFNLYFPVN